MERQSKLSKCFSEVQVLYFIIVSSVNDERLFLKRFVIYKRGRPHMISDLWVGG